MAAGDDLGSILLKAEKGRLVTSGDDAFDGGALQRRDGNAACPVAGDGGIVGAANIESVGRRRQADTAAGTQGIEWQLDQFGGVAVENPQRVVAGGDCHAHGSAAGGRGAGGGGVCQGGRLKPRGGRGG